MDRNVYRRTLRSADGYQTDAEPGAVEKLAKYFPVEAMAVYCLAQPAVLATGGSAREGLLWAALAFSLLVGAVTLHAAWRVTRTTHLLISSVAMVLLVVALGGPFATLPGYAPGYAAAAAVAATALMMLVPSPLAPRSAHPGPPGHHPPHVVHLPRETAASDRRR